LGSALTYAVWYFLLKYFHIATDEDDIDNPERKEQEEQLQQAENLRLNAIKKILTDCENEDSLKAEYLKLSENDKKTFAKLVVDLKTKLINK
jgi:hypothetical protein